MKKAELQKKLGEIETMVFTAQMYAEEIASDLENGEQGHIRDYDVDALGEFIGHLCNARDSINDVL